MTHLTAEQALANAAFHHFLSRPGASPEQITEGLVGLHNTSPVSPFLSVLARLPGFDRPELEEAMWGSWRLARFRAMRLTMFVFTHHLLEIVAAATRHLNQELATRWLRDSGLSQTEFDGLARAVDDALADGPMTARGLRRRLDVPQSVDLPGVVSRMCDAGRLVGGRPPRSWRSSIRSYHRWCDVLPDVDLHAWDGDAAMTELVRRYLRSYGPVTVADISWWTGFTKGRCRSVLEALGEEVEEVTVADWPGPLYLLRRHATTDDIGSAVHALPLLDPYVQGYRDRVRFIEPALHGCVYDGGGNSTATVISRGRVIGVWQPGADPEASIRYHLFEAAPRSIRHAAEAALATAGASYFDQPVDIIEISTMKPLNAAGGRSASHPLDSQLHRASRHQTA